MNLIELIFAIIKACLPVKESKVQDLEIKATVWYRDHVKGTRIDPLTHQEVPNENAPPTNIVTEQLRKFGEEWYFQVFLAFAYIWLVGFVREMMFPTKIEEED